MPKATVNKKGFTLIELIVTISIIAIMSVIGIVIYTSVQASARDAKRKGDIDEIAKAMELNYGKYTPNQYSAFCQNGISGGNATYDVPCTSWFGSGSIPVDSNSANGWKYCWIADTTNSQCNVTSFPGGSILPQNGSLGGANWVVCAKLEKTSASPYCKTHLQ